MLITAEENSATSQSFFEGQLITLDLLLIELKQLYPNLLSQLIVRACADNKPLPNLCSNTFPGVFLLLSARLDKPTTYFTTTD